MKVIAINGSPRKDWNTATLLKHAVNGAKSAGANTELIHLYDLNYKGCTSCFGCKLKGGSSIGRCAMRDGLTPVLQAVEACDALILGSPIYIGHVTGEMQSFLERLIFPSITYNKDIHSFYKGKVSSAFIYTMNIPESALPGSNYELMFKRNQNLLKRLNGTSEYLAVCDTYQFDDYSKYESANFDEAHKAKVRSQQFIIDCQKAFTMGAKLA